MNTQEKLNIAKIEIRNEMIIAKELADEERIENETANVESYTWETSYNSLKSLLMFGSDEQKIEWAEKNHFFLNA